MPSSGYLSARCIRAEPDAGGQSFRFRGNGQIHVRYRNTEKEGKLNGDDI